MSVGARIVSSIMVLALFLDCGIGIVEAVTFESKPTDGSQSSSPPPKVLGDSPASGKSSGGSLFYSLDVPQAQKQRLAESIDALIRTGVQAAMALENLKALDGKDVSKEEILARLVHAEECFEVVEQAAKKLEGDVELVRIACEKDPSLKQEILAMFDGLSASPAMAAYMDRFPTVNRSSKAKFGSFMGVVSSAATTIGNVANYAGSAIKSGIKSAVGAVCSGHNKAGSVVGQKTWTTIMSGVKFTATMAGGFLILAAIPATATVGVVAAGFATAGVAAVGAIASLVNDVSQIHGDGNKTVDGIDGAVTRINQAVGVIGLITGDPKKGAEVVAGVLGVSANELVNAIPGAGPMTNERANEYLPNDQQIRRYQKPNIPPKGGEGGKSSGSGSGSSY